MIKRLFIVLYVLAGLFALLVNLDGFQQGFGIEPGMLIFSLVPAALIFAVQFIISPHS